MAGLDPMGAWELAEALGSAEREKVREGTASYVRTDQDGTGWVLLPGADEATPVTGSALASARPGDVVRYRIEGGRLSVLGNASAPAVGAGYVRDAVEPVAEAAERAERLASAAAGRGDAAAAVAEEAARASSAASDGASEAQRIAQAAAEASEQARKTADDFAQVVLSSTNGTVFKRNVGVSTTVVASVFTGDGQRIEGAAALRSRYGAGAYLEWGWRDVVTDAEHVLVSTDPRIVRDGFALVVSPDDIDTQAVITCSLIY